VIWGGAALVVGLIAWRWSALLTATLNEELAYASGIDPKREQLILTLGAGNHGGGGDQGGGRSADRRDADHPRRGCAPAVPDAREHGADRRGIGAASAVIGLRAAYLLDTPAGPSIVCVAALKKPNRHADLVFERNAKTASSWQMTKVVNAMVRAKASPSGK
jgi:zinc transport system permease protein